MKNEKIIRKHRKATVAIVSIVALACIALLTACSDSDYVSPANQAENDLIVIVESINNKDSSAIKNLLSSYCLTNNKDIDSKIAEMFEFIDGEIVSYDEPFGSECGSFEKKDTSAEIRCFVTDKGTEYRIGMKRWYSYDEHPEQVGIYNITVKNLSMLSDDPESTDAVFRLEVEGE